MGNYNYMEHFMSERDKYITDELNAPAYEAEKKIDKLLERIEDEELRKALDTAVGRLEVVCEAMGYGVAQLEAIAVNTRCAEFLRLYDGRKR